MKCEVPLIAGPPGSLRWSRCGLWWLLWPSLFTETCLAGCNKQNKIWDNKNVSVFMKAQTISQEKKSFRANWKHLTSSSLLWRKKKNPQLRTIQLSLWNSHPSKNDWKEGRKEGSKEKQRKKGGRKGSKAGAEPRMWTFDHLGNMPFKSWNPLLFFSYNKTNVSLRPNLLSGKFSSEKSVVFWQVPQIVNWIKMNEQCLILLYSYYLQTKAKITKNASQHVSECSQQVYS